MQDDFNELSTHKVQIDLVIYVREKLVGNAEGEDEEEDDQYNGAVGVGEEAGAQGDEEGGLAHENFEDQYKQRMERFIEGAVQQGGARSRKRKADEWQEEDKQFALESHSFLTALKQLRISSKRDSPLRRIVVKELVWEADLSAEEDSLKAITEQIAEEVCTLSIDALTFKEWIVKKHAKLLLKSEEEAL